MVVYCEKVFDTSIIFSLGLNRLLNMHPGTCRKSGYLNSTIFAPTSADQESSLALRQTNARTLRTNILCSFSSMFFYSIPSPTSRTPMTAAPQLYQLSSNLAQVTLSLHRASRSTSQTPLPSRFSENSSPTGLRSGGKDSC